MSLLFAAYVIKSRHNRVIYLGQSLPLKDLGLISDVYKPDFVLTIVTSYPSKDEVPKYLDELSKKCPASQILVSGYQVLNFKGEISEQVVVFNTIPELINFVDKNSERPFMMNQVSRSA